MVAVLLLINRPNPPLKLTDIEHMTHDIDLVTDELDVAWNVMFGVIDAIDAGIEGHFLVVSAAVVGHIEAGYSAFTVLLMPQIDNVLVIDGPLIALFDAAMLELLR